jgi:histone H3/H4
MDEKDGGDFRLSKHAIREIGHESVDRISDDAALKIALYEERRIQEMVRLAYLVAQRAGRKTVREEDIAVVKEAIDSDYL